MRGNEGLLRGLDRLGVLERDVDHLGLRHLDIGGLVVRDIIHLDKRNRALNGKNEQGVFSA